MLDQCWRHVALEMRLCNLVELIEIAVAGIETGDDGMIYEECCISNAGLFLELICASNFLRASAVSVCVWRVPSTVRSMREGPLCGKW